MSKCGSRCLNFRACLKTVLRNLCAPFRHRRSLYDGPFERGTKSSDRSEIMSSAASAEIENCKRPMQNVRRGNADRHNHIDRLLRKHMARINREGRFVGYYVSDVSIIVSFAASGERRAVGWK